MDATCQEKIYSEDYADFMIDRGEALDNISAIPNTCSFQVVGLTYSVYVPVASIPERFIQIYGYGAYPNCYGLMDIGSLEASGVSRIQNIPALQLRGQGVLIGVVDTGIDYRHEAFIKADGTSKVFSIWDQTIRTEEGAQGAPSLFPFGTEYSQAQINQALTNTDPLSIVPSVDDNGHGTFMAGVAAGNRNEQANFSGVVPDAELIVVKLKPAKQVTKDFWRIPQDVLAYQKNDLMMGIRYLEETAQRANRPLSILIGVGTSQGAHDERGALSSYLSRLAQEDGVCVSIAAGNEGNTGHHYLGNLENNVTDAVELRVGENVQGFSMEFWGNTPANFSIGIQSPSGEVIPRIPARLQESREVRFIFERTVINVDYQLVEAQSGDQLILVRFRDPTEGIWRFQVSSNSNLAFRYHAWLPIQNFLGTTTFFVVSNPEYTLTSPGNTFIPIVSTAYNHVNQSRYINASRGFMRNENIAPTLAAPGVDIIGPNIPSGYTTSSGTSIAAAHTAGVGAMLLEWGILRGNYPQISTTEIRNLLIRGARREPNLTYPNKEWGYGILDIFSAYNTFRTSGQE